MLRDNVDEVFPRPNLPLEDSTAKDEDAINITVVTGDTNTEDELDPLPSVEEIQSAGADDVQLLDDLIEDSRTNSNATASEIDSEPLDVGNVLGEETDEPTGPEIRMLRGEDSFQLGEESLRVHPDPVTGELKFPIDDSAQEDDDRSLEASEPEET